MGTPARDNAPSPSAESASMGRRVGPGAARLGPLAGAGGGLVVEFAQGTQTGAGRRINQDAVGCWIRDDRLLFAVADGVGGCAAGEVASWTALQAMAGHQAASRSGAPVRQLRRAVAHANLALHEPGRPPMATTLTATLLGPHRLTAAHVGDCRLLRLRGGILTQLTRDHNVAGRLASLGLLGAREFVAHPGRRMVTRCLGQEPFVQIDIVSEALHPGDVYLQCSDGIAAVSPLHLIEVLVRRDPQTAAAILIERTLDAGGDDDISIQIAHIVACPATEPRASGLSRFLRALTRRDG
jgi:protein phosphatase